MYPKNWPRCPKCGDYALDGHITCGRLECNEHQMRRERTDRMGDSDRDDLSELLRR